MFKTIKQRILLGYLLVVIVSLIAAIVLTKNNANVENLVEAYVAETLPSLSADDIQTQSKELIAYSLYGTTISSREYNEKDRLVDETNAKFSQFSYMGSDAAQEKFDVLVASCVFTANDVSNIYRLGYCTGKSSSHYPSSI